MLFEPYANDGGAFSSTLSSSVDFGVSRSGQSTYLDRTVACILTRRSDQGELGFIKQKAFQIIADASISALSTPLSSEKHSCSCVKHDHGCQDLLTDPVVIARSKH